MRAMGCSLAMTLTLNFQGQIRNLLSYDEKLCWKMCWSVLITIVLCIKCVSLYIWLLIKLILSAHLHFVEIFVPSHFSGHSKLSNWNHIVIIYILWLSYHIRITYIQNNAALTFWRSCSFEVKYDFNLCFIKTPQGSIYQVWLHQVYLVKHSWNSNKTLEQWSGRGHSFWVIVLCIWWRFHQEVYITLTKFKEYFKQDIIISMVSNGDTPVMH